MANWIRNYWWLGVIAIWAFVSAQVEALRSRFWLSLLLGAALGFGLGAIQVLVRKRSRKLQQTSSAMDR